MSKSKYVVKLTMEQAKTLGIVVCANCGYPPNNHWSEKRGSGCAHVKCAGYKPSFRTGRAI